MKGARAILLVALALTQVSCGYALAGRGSFLPNYIRTVGIPPLENHTTFFTVEQMLTDKIRAEFIGRGKYRISSDAAGTDAVLTGDIISMSVQPTAFNEQQLGTRYLITMVMRVRFTDARTNEVLWSNDQLTFREEYELALRTTGGVDAALLDQERSSLDRVSTDIARTVVTAIVEAF